jgi:hypothetical protein
VITLTQLKDFQKQRLRDTYADLIARPEYTAACDFFFGTVYTAEDTRGRDHQFEKFTNSLKGVIAGSLIHRCLNALVALQHLTTELDDILLAELHRMNIADPLNMDDYEEAYRLCGNYAEREEQIEVLVSSLISAHQIYRKFGVGIGLKALHKFHQIQGDTTVTAFLLEGYRAFKSLREIEPLASIVEERETRRLNRIFRVEDQR